MKYSIYQAPITEDFVFRPFGLVRDKIVPDFSHNWEGHYNKVFEGELSTQDNDLVILEHLFHVFNVDHPDGYKGRSLSVSDIVVIEEGAERRVYYCDSFGWEVL